VIDEPDLSLLVMLSLKRAGLDPAPAEDAGAALLFARDEQPGLIILDAKLPGVSGIEVCKALKKDALTAKIPIIMLAAKAEEVDRIVGFALGADDYITMPFSPKELVLRIKSVLRRTKWPVEEWLSAQGKPASLGRN
jgi:DNA-binding response OmpR family regulator